MSMYDDPVWQLSRRRQRGIRGVRAIVVALVVSVFLLVGCGSRDGGISVHGPPLRGPYPDGVGGAGDSMDGLVVEQDANTVYASGQKCNVYKSGDGGATWRVVFKNDHPTSLFEDCAFNIAIAPDGTLFLATTNGLFKSTDHARKWTKAGLAAPIVNGIAIDPADSQTIFAAASDGVAIRGGTTTKVRNGGVYKSTNGGDSWQWVGLQRQDVDAVAVASGAKVVYAATTTNVRKGGPNLGVFKSVDGGVTWRRTGLHSPWVGQLVVEPQRPTTVFTFIACRAASGSLSSCLLVTDDGGKSWRKVGPNEKIKALAADPQKPRVVYAGTEVGVFGSVDGGTSWRLLALRGKYVWALAIAPTGRTLYAGTEKGAVFRLRLGR
jgi:photosystem II stability/assembly factor-like uncharacterized protein